MKKAIGVVVDIFLIILVILAILLVGVRVAGIRPYTVISGSMEPEYPVGSIVYVKDIEVKNVEVGDVITFVLDDKLNVATHRVVGVDFEEGYSTTKGDANNSNDGSPVYFENYLGKVVACIPYLGYIIEAITRRYFKYIFAVILSLTLGYMLASNLLKRKMVSGNK